MNIWTTDPRILAVAFLGGLIPSLLWLWFWLKEEEKPEPSSLLAMIFIMGMIAVLVVLPIQRFIQAHTNSPTAQLILWASAEEIMKYLAVWVIVYKTKDVTEPIDWPIYLITAALGFAALENALFLIQPFSIRSNYSRIIDGPNADFSGQLFCTRSRAEQSALP